MSVTLTQMGGPATAQRETAGWGLWRRWTLFTAVGELVGFAAPAIVMAAGTVGRWSDTAQLVAAVLAGAVEGAVLGLAQGRVLHRSLPALSQRAWVLSTALGAMAAYLLAMIAVALGDFAQRHVALLVVGGAVLGISFLLSIGLPQWLVLRRHLPKAGWWMPANAVAWPLGVAMPFILLALVPDASPFLVWAVAGIASGVLMGLIVGAITGLVLERLWRIKYRSDHGCGIALHS